MQLEHDALTYGGENSSVSLHKEIGNNITIHADIAILSDKFVEYQKTILDEFFAQLFDLTYSEDIMFDDIINGFEQLLGELNMKLETFASKITDAPFFDIRGSIQLFRHQDYIASLIGDVTLLVVRANKVQYTLHNDRVINRPIAVFSDFIQGDIFPEDRIFVIGGDVTEYFDHYDLQDFVNGIAQAPDTIAYTRDMLKQRCDVEQLGIVAYYGLAPKASVISAKSLSTIFDGSAVSKFLGSADISSRGAMFMNNTRQLMSQYRYAIVIGLFSLFLLYLVYGLIANFVRNNTTNTINPDGTISSTLTIEDIKKEIVQFQKMDPSSAEKVTKYEALRKQLRSLEEQGKRANDVAQLKTILTTEYYRGFNIVMIDNLTDQNVYTLSSLEKSTIGIPMSIFYTKSFTIAGDKGVLIGGISDEVRGNNIVYSLDMSAKTCTLNLLKDGVYCVSPDGRIFNTNKAGSADVKVEGGSFPEGVEALGTFGSANFYLLLNNKSLATDGVYIMKYSNALGSQVAFNPGVLLPVADIASMSALPEGFSTLSIDGTFLLWSKDKKALYQMYRDASAKSLTAREVPINGGTNIGDGYSEYVKVLASPTSKYVYLFDKKNQTFTVYTTTPLKTNDAYTSSYNLEYVMRVNFGVPNNTIIDAAIDENNSKQTLYVLHNEGVAKISISDYIQNFVSAQTTTN